MSSPDYDFIIAQDDDNDYEESGYVAFLKDGKAFLARYSHCSCYGTWESGAIRTTWDGTTDDLVKLARDGGDPDMPGRLSSPDDSDHDHLMETYRQIIEWDANGRPITEKK